MNIKSLLLGSAAALAVVSGAQAADAIVAAEPEPAEYVKVCDAFGTGYFYIPGTETCLKIGGYVRFNVGFNSKAGKARAWDASTKADINLSAKSDTEYGALEGYIEAVAVDGGAFSMDAAYLSLGGFKAGYYAGYWDAGIGENSSWARNAKFNSVSYTFSGDAFSAGVQVDEIGAGSSSVADLGIEGLAKASLGGVTASLTGVYDTTAEEGAIKGILSAEVGPGTFSAAAVWASGVSTYYAKEWSVGAAYSIKATDQLTVMPEFQYSEDFAGVSDWFVGALVGYQITDGLKASVDVNYNKNESFTGYFRLQRSF